MKILGVDVGLGNNYEAKRGDDVGEPGSSVANFHISVGVDARTSLARGWTRLA